MKDSLEIKKPCSQQKRRKQERERARRILEQQRLWRELTAPKIKKDTDERKSIKRISE